MRDLPGESVVNVADLIAHLSCSQPDDRALAVFEGRVVAFDILTVRRTTEVGETVLELSLTEIP